MILYIIQLHGINQTFKKMVHNYTLYGIIANKIIGIINRKLHICILLYIFQIG